MSIAPLFSPSHDVLTLKRCTFSIVIVAWPTLLLDRADWALVQSTLALSAHASSGRSSETPTALSQPAECQTELPGQPSGEGAGGHPAIARSWSSLQRQTEDDWEALVVISHEAVPDSGGDPQDPRWRWCPSTANHWAEAVNQAIASARGEWIWVIGAGDVMPMTTTLHMARQQILDHPGLDGWVSGWQWQTALQPASPWQLTSQGNSKSGGRDRALQADQWMTIPDVPGSALVVRRSAWVRVGGLDETLSVAALWELGLRLITDGCWLAWRRQSMVEVLTPLPWSYPYRLQKAPKVSRLAWEMVLGDPNWSQEFELVWQRWCHQAGSQSEATLRILYRHLASWHLSVGGVATAAVMLGRSCLGEAVQSQDAWQWLDFLGDCHGARGFTWDASTLVAEPAWRDLLAHRPLRIQGKLWAIAPEQGWHPQVPSGVNPLPPPRHRTLGYVFYRIVGNDLPPCHQAGQTVKNLEFLLTHEPPLVACEKRWVVNRIADRTAEAAILTLLDQHHVSYLHLPLDLDEYAQVDFQVDNFLDADVTPNFFQSSAFAKLSSFGQEVALDTLYDAKNRYVMHNNGARNWALAEGRSRGRWILPWDGNCFMDAVGWAALREAIAQEGDRCAYGMVPMARLLDNQDSLDPTAIPNPVEEPQIVFRNDAQEEFNPHLRYGYYPKVELLKRLQVPGQWDAWSGLRLYSWVTPPLDPPVSQPTFTAGWVLRLVSGNASTTDDADQRRRDRSAGIRTLLDHLDETILRRTFAPDQTVLYSLPALQDLRQGIHQGNAAIAAQVAALAHLADQIAHRFPHPYAVPNLADPPPAQPPHAELAPTVDPNPTRSPFQTLAVMALAGFVTGRDRDGDWAITEVRSLWERDPTAWAIAPCGVPSSAVATAANSEGTAPGQAWDDWVVLLDAVRLLEHLPPWTPLDHEQMGRWLRSRLDWLQHSEPAREAAAQLDGVGTQVTLQRAAIALFLDQVIPARWEIMLSRLRPLPPAWEAETQFDLVQRLHLARLGQRVGQDLWRSRDRHPATLADRMAAGITHLLHGSPAEQAWGAALFWQARTLDAQFALPPVTLPPVTLPPGQPTATTGSDPLPAPIQLPPLYPVMGAIAPFWNLAPVG